MYWLLFLGMVAFGLALVLLFTTELAKRLEFAPKDKSKGVTPDSTAAERGSGSVSPIVNDAPVDANAIKESKTQSGQNVTLSEKSALGLFKLRKTKHEQPGVGTDTTDTWKSK